MASERKSCRKSSAPRSCIVGTEMGTQRRRNREQLLVTNEQLQRVPTDLEDGSHSTSSSDNHVPSTNTNPLHFRKKRHRLSFSSESHHESS